MNTPTSQPSEFPGTYYLTQDSRSLLRKLYCSMQKLDSVNGSIGKSIDAIADEYWTKVVATMRTIFPEVTAFPEETIESSLRSLVEQELRNKPERKILCLDRYLLRNETFPVSRLEITRMEDKSKQRRQASPPLLEQLQRLRSELGDAEVIVVDDGTYSGGTMRYALETLKTVNINVRKCIVFLGNPNLTEVEDIPILCIEQLKNMIDWVDGRDFTLFAGRMQKISRTGHVATAKPYTPPFSDGSGASLNDRPEVLSIGNTLLQAEWTMLDDFEKLLNTRVRIRDVLKAHFPLPLCTDMPRFALSANMNAVNEAARNLLRARSLPMPKEAVIDMDGTLYRLDGPQNGFAGSSLQRSIEMYALQYIQRQEFCDIDQAQKLLAKAKTDTVGPSRFFADRYGVTRGDYFTATWGKVDVETIIKKETSPKETLRSLQEKNVRCKLLTAAPNIWAEKVLDYLDVRPYFEQVTAAEKFTTKAEVYKQMLENCKDPQSILAVGDQYETDICPAAKLGMRTFQVTRENPLSYLQFLNI
jgi:FMN phosphatase YigB (HAD superfamily)